MITLGNIISVLGWLIAPVCSGFIVAWREQKKRNAEIIKQQDEAKEKQLKAISDGLAAVIRSNLVTACETYARKGSPLTVERKHELTQQYLAYESLGYNGMGKEMFEEISEVPTAIIGSTS